MRRITVSTSCLTPSIDIALRYFIMNHQLPNNTTAVMVLVDLKDRRTPLGELNRISTAITDTKAWTTFSRDIFTKLYRCDSLIASLFRKNYEELSLYAALLPCFCPNQRTSTLGHVGFDGRYMPAPNTGSLIHERQKCSKPQWPLPLHGGNHGRIGQIVRQDRYAASSAKPRDKLSLRP